MAGSINKVVLIGNLGQDPEVRSFSNGNRVCSFSLATTESWRDKQSGERKDKTEWHRISIFNEGLIKVCENYLKKGSKIYLEGALQTRKWTDKDNNERYTTEVVVQNFRGELVMLDGRPSGGGTSGGGEYKRVESGQVTEAPKSATADNYDLDDEVPF